MLDWDAVGMKGARPAMPATGYTWAATPVAIIANGQRVNVHRCVFRGLKISAVYWTPGSKGHAMTHCLCHDLYGSGVWTAVIANDFVYRNNVVEGSNYVWTAQGDSRGMLDIA